MSVPESKEKGEGPRKQNRKIHQYESTEKYLMSIYNLWSAIVVIVTI